MITIHKKKKITLVVDEELVLQLKHFAVTKGKSYSGIVENALHFYLSNENNKN